MITIPRVVLALLFLAACSDPGAADPLELQTCESDESPAELLRLEGIDLAIPVGPAVSVFDLGIAVSVRTADNQKHVFDLVNNCGGAPLRLRNTLELPTGAANVGGDVVLCGGARAEEEGVRELLSDGSAGHDLGLGIHCDTGDEHALASFGFVATDEGFVQHLPTGQIRSVGPSWIQLLWTGEGPSVFSLGSEPTIYPADGSPAIAVDVPEKIVLVVRQRGKPSASGWVLGAPQTPYGRSSSDPEVLSPYLYAIDLKTGASFQTPVVQNFFEGSSLNGTFSIREGLLATFGEYGGALLSRAGWEGTMGVLASSFAVLDSERVFLVEEEQFRIIRVPPDWSEQDVDYEFEELWSRPRPADDGSPVAAGVEWNGLVLIERAEAIWAYPLDGREPYSFLPWSYRDPAYLHYGDRYMTGLGIRPQTDADIWLYRNSVDGEFEVVDEDIVSGSVVRFFSSVSFEHSWTPDLGRVVYAVRDGDAVSIRQHRLDD